MRTFLHVGCGRLRKSDTTRGFATSEWRELRLDIDPAVAPDIVAAMTDMSAVADGSAEAVYSAHSLEHVFMFEVPAVLAEFRRVLTADGFLVLTCPDLQAVAARVAEGRLTETAYVSPAGPVSPLDMIYGLGRALQKGREHMAHKCGFTADLLGEALRQAGFGAVVVLRRPREFDLWAIASKPERSQAEMLALARDHFPLQGIPDP